ncbi:MAG: DUF433 domain-containing protein [Acidobacteria bacterium]|nr:DUF433 domain-containing protein [Acidobacteriota bacterium]
MAAIVDIGTMITQVPGIHSGRPIIAGTGVTVQRIAIWHNLGLSPEEIVDRIGHLTLAQIYAALAYYYANREVVDTDIAAAEEIYETKMREQFLKRQPQP